MGRRKKDTTPDLFVDEDNKKPAAGPKTAKSQKAAKGENGDADRFNPSGAVQSSRHTPCAVVFPSLLAFIRAHSWLKWFLPFQLFAFIRG